MRQGAQLRENRNSYGSMAHQMERWTAGCADVLLGILSVFIDAYPQTDRFYLYSRAGGLRFGGAKCAHC
jgi:hypothetical protein